MVSLELIDDYNVVAGEVAEPYRVVVVFDYPAGFTEAAAQQLLSLVENGPRCGLHTIVLTDSAREQPRDLPLDRLRHTMQRVRWTSRGAQLSLAAPIGDVSYAVETDTAPPITFAQNGTSVSVPARLITEFGEGSRSAGTEAVTLDRLLPVLNRMSAARRSRSIPDVPAGSTLSMEPSSWWKATTAGSAIAPLGKSGGAHDVASLFFSSTDIAGGDDCAPRLPCSGKDDGAALGDPRATAMLYSTWMSLSLHS